LGDEWLSTSPLEPAVHWTPQLLPIDPELPLTVGEEAFVHVSRPRGGQWSWRVAVGEHQRSGSTFLSQPQLASQLRALVPSHQPRLNEAGRLRHAAFELFDGNRANKDIADALLAKFPRQFVDREEAVSFVQAMAMTYTH
jgi:hypothetical protein